MTPHAKFHKTSCCPGGEPTCKGWTASGSVSVVTDASVWRIGDRDVFEAVMKDGGEDLATVWMYANPDIEDGMTVEGVVRVVRQQTISVAATTVKAFTEHRLVDAVRVGP